MQSLATVSWSGLVQGHTFAPALQVQIYPNLMIVCAIRAGLASSFVASSSSFLCFLLSLQGDSRHICGTKHLCLPARVRRETQAQPWWKCPNHAMVMAWSKYDKMDDSIARHGLRRINSVQSPQKVHVWPLYTVFSFAGCLLLVSFRAHRVCPKTRSAKHQAWSLDQQ